MNQLIVAIVFSFFISQFSTAHADTPAISVAVELFPVGSFTVSAPSLQGTGINEKNHYFAKELKVAVADLDTGIDLRTTHLKKKLKADEYPYITAKNVDAHAGKGTASLTIMNVTKEISFTYEDLGAQRAQARFTLNLKDFAIGGIRYLGVGVQDEVEVTATVSYENK